MTGFPAVFAFLDFHVPPSNPFLTRAGTIRSPLPLRDFRPSAMGPRIFPPTAHERCRTAIKSPTLRYIAGCEIDKLFPGIGPERREEYVTSVVRQWLTNDRKAGVFTVAVNYWLNLVERGSQLLVGLEVCPSNMRQVLGPWKAFDDELPKIVHRLTLAQSATFVNADGVTVRVRADPIQHGFGFEEVKDEDGDQG